MSFSPVDVNGLYQGGLYDYMASVGPDGRIDITKLGAVFFSPVCDYAGAAVQSGNRMKATGTYECATNAGREQGTWSTADLAFVDGRFITGCLLKTASGSGATSQECIGGLLE
jgi:hypothetical protein